MEVFKISLVNVLIILCFILPGFLLGKFHLADGKHLKTLSTLLVYVLGPAMFIDSFSKIEFSWDTTRRIIIFFLLTFVLQLIFLSILFLLFRRKYENAKYRIFTIGSVMGNVGYFGLPVVSAIYKDFSLATIYSCIYVLSMNILVFTFGVFCITQDKKYMSIKKALLNPTVFGFIIAFILYALNVSKYLDSNLVTIKIFDAVNLLSKMSAPICMIVLGIRLSTVNFLSLWTRPFVYLTVVFKGLIFPLFAFLVTRWLPFLYLDDIGVITILSAAPCGAIVLSLAEIHHKEEELSANTVLVTTLLSFITIPIITLLLNI